MYTYKTEILTVSTKWWSDKANAADAAELDELLNRRAAEGWELVTYDYMATSTQIKGAFITGACASLEICVTSGLVYKSNDVIDDLLMDKNIVSFSLHP